MDDIIQESEVAVDVEVEVGAAVEVGADFVHHGMITWPTSSTPRSGVTW